MKKSDFGCWGHAFNRKFYYSKNGKFNEFTVSGGASFIQQLLSFKGLAEYIPFNDTYRCDYVELKQFEDKQAKKTYYAVDRRLGFTEGSVIPITTNDANYALVWDEGLGNITLPDEDIPVLWASNKVLPEKAVFDKIAGHCFLLLDVEVLRNSGAMISSRISWERSATELIWQLQNSPALTYLHQAPHLLITFAEDGAVYIKREQGNPSAWLVLAHGGGEGALREKINGTIDDSFALMTTALALQFPDIIKENPKTPARHPELVSGSPYVQEIADQVRNDECVKSIVLKSPLEENKSLQILPVLKAAENLLLNGYTLDQLKSGHFDIPAPQTDSSERWFTIPYTPGQNVIDPDFWRISNNVNNKRIFDTAFDYVLKGTKVIEGFPQLSFGALTTIDRWEIESYRNICNLIDNYVRTDSVRPLSIAVFGAPGSGKSFGVTQIAKNILPGKVEKLEFNVSQFTDNTDLGIAFQKVRDVTLEGKLPLVFFDEFDSNRNGIQLGWLKNFLMPMQDGKFKDESGEHPIGKCILVFAGGTSASFEEFTNPMLLDHTEAHKQFKDVKGPDFVSRLRGTINVLGPNQCDANDNNYILRRALLLRSLCERKLKMKKGEDAPISQNVLWAMLLVPKYKHGARSMEAILDMSRIEGNAWEPVSLPFYSQLSLHVDADAFIKLVLREVILNSYMETLAIAIHEDFRKKNPGTDYDMPWNELTRHIKESNRNQARDIAAKLKSIGCEYDSGDTPFPSIEKFDDETVLLLAQKEHERYWKEKLKAGWTYAPVRDNAKKHNPTLVAWDKLPPEEQQKDMDAVENIIPLLKGIGLRVYRTI